jgi:ketosteroid isomerase-like protein
MRKQSPRPSVRKLCSFDIRPKKPPRHPSSAARRQDAFRTKVKTEKGKQETENTHMPYSRLIKKLIRRSFDDVNNHNYDELLKAVAPNVHHRFAGAHSIGGERHDKEAMRRWLERVGRVLPNLHIKINDIWVKGGPWHTKVFVQWDATATLLNGDSSYFNRGFHVITMRWGKVYSLDVFEDSQEVARGLAIQAESGLEEAVAEQIVS